MGVAIAAGAVVLQGKTAFGAEGTTWWNDFIAASDAHSFTWDDVFGPDKYGEDMYSLVYAKLITFPGKSALKEVASSYGLTQQETRSVLNGSITPIFNNPNLKTRQLSQEEALKMLKEMQEEFALKSEAYALEQEVDATIKPSELFADGDLSNSGFDLVYDLNKIEEILFLNESPVDVGAPYSNASDSPTSPTEDKQKADGFVANNTDVAVGPLSGSSGELNENGNLQIGDKEIAVEVLNQDVCVDESSPLDMAANDFSDRQRNVGDGANLAEDGQGGANGEGINNGDSGGQAGTGGGVSPAPADDWASEWCKGINSDAQGGDEVNVQISACIDIQMIKKTVSTYQAGDSCIACELEQIDTWMDKTLSHSLIPGKATGNLLESAKCKGRMFAIPLLNFPVIKIWNPVPTPPKDDLIEKGNVFEEWNKFVKSYKPLDITGSLWNLKLDTWDTFDNTIDPQSSGEFLQKLKQQSAPPGISQQELLSSINSDQLQYQAEAVTNLQEAVVTTAGTNKIVYFDAVLQEVQQMAAFMKNFSDTYKLIINEALPKIWSKPNID